MPINYLGTELLELELIQEANEPSFVLSGDNGRTSISINYDPILDKEYSHNDYVIYLFENCYLNAENDVFQVYEGGIKERIGWIFSLSNLESKENDEYENPHLNKYKFVAFQLLLLAKDRTININEARSEITLSELYPKNPIIAIFAKSQLSKVESFRIENYYPTLSKYGYYPICKDTPCKKIISKEEFCLQIRSKKKIKIFKSQFDISERSFFYELFTNSLKSFDHHLIRFHLLYQIIEYFLHKKFDDNFTKLLDTFTTDKSITKNDFIERINEAKRERTNIKSIVNDIKENRNIDFIETDMKRDCKFLLDRHSDKTKDDLGDLIYDMRNLIMHNYRSINSDELVTLDSIIHQLELLVINLLEKQSA